MLGYFYVDCIDAVCISYFCQNLTFMRHLLFFSCLFLVNQFVYSQHLSPKQQDGIKKHVSYLASDKLEGRAPGTQGELLAANYIAKKFKTAGLKPGGDNNTFFHGFEFAATPIVNEAKTSFKLINKTYALNQDFWPLNMSASGSASGKVLYLRYGIVSEEMKYNDYEGYKRSELKDAIFVLEVSTPDGVHPHSKYLKQADLSSRVKVAEELGAAAVIFVNNYQAETPSTSMSKSSYVANIPVIFAQGFANKVLLDGGPQNVEISTLIERPRVNAKNVVAYLDNGAANNIIIGAHYDHLGWGEDGSLYRGEEKMIHNGADDNASGTSALIALAQYLAKSEFKNNNYVFIAFSAEEKGLFGSNAFAKSNLFNASKANYMLNMDMVGRLENNELAINGVGTSSMWGNNLTAIKAGNLKIKMSESGIGPSDHTSFYLKDIPVLHFFTGTHNDYHKPTDDADKINYEGISQVSNFIIELIQKLDSQGKLDFQKTKEVEQSKAPKYSVTLGIVPDYMYDGKGIKIDGVTEGKPASAAKILANDVLVQMGDLSIDNMKDYMSALSKFKKGDAVNVIVLRNGEKLELKVVF